MAWETETKPKNPRKARKAKSLQASKLSEALNFIACASNQAGSMPFQAHARMAGNWIVATDGAICAGHPIEEDMALCPHTGKLIDALNKAGTQLSMTARDNGTLMITGDRLKAIVPCIPGDDIPAVFPDPNVAAISDTIKEGFAKLVPLMKLKPNGSSKFRCCFVTTACSVATDRLSSNTGMVSICRLGAWRFRSRSSRRSRSRRRSLPASASANDR
jgi:hypothetical protein